MEVKFTRMLAKKFLSTRNVPSTRDGIPKTMNEGNLMGRNRVT